MMNRCNLYLGAASVGEASWSVVGSKVHISAACPFEEGYIYRPTLRAGEFSLPLGVMLPREDRFQVRKTLPLDRCGPLLRAEEVRGEIYRSLPGEEEGPLPFPFSRLAAADGQKLSRDDALLNQAVAREPGTLYARFGERLYIAYPLREDEASAFLPFFCVSTAITVAQGRYGVLCVDGDGFICAL